LAKIEGISEFEADTKADSGPTATFVAVKGLDVKKTLDELANAGNKHIKGWSQK